MKTATLSRWRIVRIGKTRHLIGVVSGHDRLRDDHWAITSPVTKFDPGGTWAVTASQGRRYTLVDPDTDPEPPHEVLELLVAILLRWGEESATFEVLSPPPLLH